MIQIFPYALSIGIFPYLADMARERDKQPLTDTLMGALRACFFFFLPVTAILLTLSVPLLRAVWESGNFSQTDTLTLVGPFVGFSIGLVAFASEMMLNQTFYAMTRAWLPTLTGLATTVLWVAIATWGVHAGWGLFAIALAESISKSVKCIAMWILLRPFLGDTKPREQGKFLVQVLAASVAAALAAWLLSSLLMPIAAPAGAAPSKLKMLLAVGISGLCGMVVFTVLASMLKMSEAAQVLAVGKKLRRRKK